MSSPDLNVCCYADPQFGEHEEKKLMGCDKPGQYFCSTTGLPCDPNEETCDEGLGECIQGPNLAGDVSFSSDLTYIFTRNGTGTVNFDLVVSAIGCPTALPGTGSEDLEPGDYIKCVVDFDVSINSGPIYRPDEDVTFVNMNGDVSAPVPIIGAVGQDDAATGLSCSMSLDCLFTDAGWDGHCCAGSISWSVRLSGFHSDNSPANFCIKGISGGYAIQVTASITGDCCEHTDTFSDVDEL